MPGRSGSFAFHPTLMNLLEYASPFFSGALYAIGLVAVFLVPMLALELLLPARRLHGPTLLFNLLYAPLYLTLAAMALHPVSASIAPLLPQNAIEGVLGSSLDRASTWQVGLLVGLYLVLFDFGYYWLHRAQHRFAWLWRFHRFHHADVNISISSSTRHHWIEETMRYLVFGIPLLVLFGQPERTLPWLGILVGVQGMFIHWNSRLRLGPLTRWIVGPQYHRIHHSFAPEHIDKNFCVFFPFWDALFGTQCLPRGAEFPPSGVTDGCAPNGLAQLLPWPVATGRAKPGSGAQPALETGLPAQRDRSRNAA